MRMICKEKSCGSNSEKNFINPNKIILIPSIDQEICSWGLRWVTKWTMRMWNALIVNERS